MSQNLQNSKMFLKVKFAYFQKFPFLQTAEILKETIQFGL